MSNSIRVKIILAENLLRRPFTADGPISLEGMFEVGYPNRASMSRHAREFARLAASKKHMRRSNTKLATPGG
jgi:hypothetical protein